MRTVGCYLANRFWRIIRNILTIKTLLVFALVFGGVWVCFLQTKEETLTVTWPWLLDPETPREFTQDRHCLPKRGSQSGVECGAIFENNQYVKKHRTNYTPSLGCELNNLVKDCDLLRAVHGYNLNNSTYNSEAEYFPIAYGIKLHKAAEQGEQLLRAIYHPNNVYCIHVDKKSPIDMQNLFLNISRCFDNVHVLENNLNVGYATFDMIVAEMTLMSLCRNASKSWKYYINLTGQEFPLKTNWEIIQILKLMSGSNDIESYPYHRGQLQERVLDKVQLPYPRNITPYKGSAYGIFSQKFVDFILDSPVATEIIYYFKNASAPEEIIWATLNRIPEAPGGLTVDTRHEKNQHVAKAVIWEWDEHTCRGKFVRSVCVFGAGDLMWLRSRPELFANKFDVSLDRLAIDCLEEEIRNRTRSPVRRFLNFNFYRHLPQVR